MVSEVDEFRLRRMRAIEAFAGLESWHCGILAALVPCRTDTAFVLFFRMDQPNRLSAVKSLMSRDYPEFLNAWRVLSNSIQKAVEARNRIVHWDVLNASNGLVLTNPKDPPTATLDRSGMDVNYKSLTVDDFDALANRCQMIVDILPDLTSCLGASGVNSERRGIYAELPKGAKLEDLHRFFEAGSRDDAD